MRSMLKLLTGLLLWLIRRPAPASQPESTGQACPSVKQDRHRWSVSFNARPPGEITEHPVRVELNDGTTMQIDLCQGAAVELARFLAEPAVPKIRGFDSRQGRYMVSWRLCASVPAVCIQSPTEWHGPKGHCWRSLPGAGLESSRPCCDMVAIWLTEDSASTLARAITKTMDSIPTRDRKRFGIVWRVGINADTGMTPWMSGYPVRVELRDGGRIDLPLKLAEELAAFLTDTAPGAIWGFDSRQGQCLASRELCDSPPGVRIQVMYSVRDVATAWLTERSATGLGAAIKDSIRQSALKTPQGQQQRLRTPFRGV